MQEAMKGGTLTAFITTHSLKRLPKAELLCPPVRAQHTSLSSGSAKTQVGSQELNTFQIPSSWLWEH